MLRLSCLLAADLKFQLILHGCDIVGECRCLGVGLYIKLILFLFKARIDSLLEMRNTSRFFVGDEEAIKIHCVLFLIFDFSFLSILRFDIFDPFIYRLRCGLIFVKSWVSKFDGIFLLLKSSFKDQC